MTPRLAALLCLALATIAPVRAQEDPEPPPVTIPTLAANAKDAAGFAPPGWTVETQKSGDLDGDGRADIAFVLKQSDPKNVLKNDGLGSDELDTNPGVLGVAVATAEGFRLATQNATLIPRHVIATMSDPFSADDLAVARGAVRITLHLFMSAGGWEMSDVIYTFRLKGGALELIGYDRENTQRNSGEITSISINYASGKMSRGTGTIESDRLKTVWGKAPVKRHTVETIGDGLDFDPTGERSR